MTNCDADSTDTDYEQPGDCPGGEDCPGHAEAPADWARSTPTADSGEPPY